MPSAAVLISLTAFSVALATESASAFISKVPSALNSKITSILKSLKFKFVLRDSFRPSYILSERLTFAFHFPQREESAFLTLKPQPAKEITRIIESRITEIFFMVNILR